MRRSRVSEVLLAEGLKWRQEETWFGARVGRVEDRRGGCSLPVGCRRRFRPPPQSGLTWFRFLSPLVKPDVQISRIRLSPASSSLRAWQVGATERQGVQAERLVEVLVRVLAVPGACLSAASHQPSLKPPLHIPAHDPVGR